jgi:hypothetical protein
MSILITVSIGLIIALLCVRFAWLTAKPERLKPNRRVPPNLTGEIPPERLKTAIEGLHAVPDDDYRFIDEASAVPNPRSDASKSKLISQKTKTGVIIPQTGRHVFAARKMKWHLEIIYGRGARAGQRRRIVVVRANGHIIDGKFCTETLLARCQAANDWRAFKTEYIAQLIDLDTGEVARDPQSWINTTIQTNA